MSNENKKWVSITITNWHCNNVTMLLHGNIYGRWWAMEKKAKYKYMWHLGAINTPTNEQPQQQLCGLSLYKHTHTRHYYTHLTLRNSLRTIAIFTQYFHIFIFITFNFTFMTAQNLHIFFAKRKDFHMVICSVRLHWPGHRFGCCPIACDSFFCVFRMFGIVIVSCPPFRWNLIDGDNINERPFNNARIWTEHTHSGEKERKNGNRRIEWSMFVHSKRLMLNKKK